MAKRKAAGRLTRRKLGQLVISAIVYLLLIECMYLFLHPFLYMLINSMKYEFDIKDVTQEWLVLRVNSFNYTEALRLMNYGKTLTNTLLLVIGSTLGHLLSCMMTGYGLARFGFKGRNLIFVLAVMSIIVPPQLFMIPSYIMFNKLGWTGTMMPIIGPTFVGFGLKGGLFIFLFRQAFKALPPSYEEAAKIEGCGQFRIFFRIILPMVKSSILVCMMLSVIWHWNDYFEPLIYLRGSNRILTQQLETLNNAVYATSSGSGVSMNPVSLAGCVLTVAPLLVFYFGFSQQFVKGIELTGLAN